MWRLYPILVEAELESQHSNWSTVCILYSIYIQFFEVCKFWGCQKFSNFTVIFWGSPGFRNFIDFMSIPYQACCTCDITASDVQSRLSVCLAKHPVLSLVWWDMCTKLPSGLLSQFTIGVIWNGLVSLSDVASLATTTLLLQLVRLTLAIISCKCQM